MPTLDTAEILNILKMRRQHCRNLLDLSRRQRGLIDASDYSHLLTVLGQKQRLLGRLDELNTQHPDFRGQWARLRTLGDPEWRDGSRIFRTGKSDGRRVQGRLRNSPS